MNSKQIFFLEKYYNKYACSNLVIICKIYVSKLSCGVKVIDKDKYVET